MKYNKMIEYYKELRSLEGVLALLNWDQSVFMPTSGIVGRSETMANVTKIMHEKSLDEDFYRIVCDLSSGSENSELTGVQKDEVQLLKYDLEKVRKVPVELASELVRVASLALGAWEKAKESGDDKEYLPLLKNILELKVEYASCIGYEHEPYDALLDDYDRGLTYAYIEPLFDEVEKKVSALLSDIQEQMDGVDDSFLKKEFDQKAQWDFGVKLLKDMGINFDNFRQDSSEHPFTTTIGTHDVRITTHIYPSNVKSGLFSTVHEGGHALYELGASECYPHSPCGVIQSLALHESQSRFYENVICRGIPFWNTYYPELQRLFPDNLKGVDQKSFEMAINKAGRSHIRVEADEFSYNLHVVLRTKLEHELINGKIKVDDINEAWNEKTKQVLGFYPENKSLGYLQDVHWSDGLFGYFPSYTMGNLIAAQFYKILQKDLGNPDSITPATFGKIQEWLKERFYSYGSRLTSVEVVRKLTGEDLHAGYFIDYLEEKVKTIF